MIFVPVEIYPKVELLDNMVILLTFRGTSILFSIGAAPIFTFPSIVYKVAFSPHLHQQFFFFLFIGNSYPKRSEVRTHCGFDLYFPDYYCC